MWVVVLLIVAMLVYPFIVYANLEFWGADVLAWILLAILIARVVVRGKYRDPEQYLQLVLVGGLCIVSAVFNSEKLLRFYPVAMSMIFAVFFFTSLGSETSLIERFTTLWVNKEYEVHQKHYMRQLTKVWGGLMLLNALVAGYTACCTSLKIWTLYNGFLVYLLFLGVGAGELLFRQFYKKRFE